MLKSVGLDRRKQGSIGHGEYIACHLLRVGYKWMSSLAEPGRLVRIGGRAGGERGMTCGRRTWYDLRITEESSLHVSSAVFARALNVISRG